MALDLWTVIHQESEMNGTTENYLATCVGWQTSPFRPCEMLSPGWEFLAGCYICVSARVRPMDALGTGFATTFF
jgi:hypothetical protein